jgi:hypothetical protein
MSDFSFKLDKPDLTADRSIEISFVVKSQAFIVLNDLDNDGSLSPSASFYKAADGKPDQFIFWTDRPITDPQIAKYVFTEFFAKDGLTADSTSGQALTPNKIDTKKPKKPRVKKRYCYQHNTTTLIETIHKSSPAINNYGILRLENDRNCVDSFGIELIKDNDLTQINQPETVNSLTIMPFGVSKLAWLQAEGAFVKGEYQYRYDMIEKGTYEVVNETETEKEVIFYGEKIHGVHKINLVDNQIIYLGEEDGQ